MGSLSERFKSILGAENVLEHEPMSRHTTFRTGGAAAYYLTVTDEEKLLGIINVLQEDGVPYTVLGNGSNILVSDNGYDGAVVKLSGDFTQISAKGLTVTAGAGAKLSELAAFARDKALSGFVFASGIPGTVGGALIMNAGAFGGEMADVCRSVRVLNPAGGRVESLSAEDMSFGYRTSRVKGTDGIILSAEFLLEEGDREEISRAMEELAARRNSADSMIPSVPFTLLVR